MDESAKADAVTEKQNEEYVESEGTPEGDSGNHEDMDVDLDHPSEHVGTMY